ncbi:tRNA pseudouridine(55) synthase TruB [Fusobacterium sp.]|uniref:tRNA pseudouridine(55) synthase TruB n=1 Tax=Fusobacterium sp. TaxID=68766 RepID=UPI0029051E46|nr:tRNA pseudouridine(55) synthase TruB [Fusobacterium sp.]MDU1911519.1 tRNA pseudouridine(55) synthase TruB [Fusobacterium sp.]
MEGIINVNKPSGITSFDVIRKLRRILHERKIGHTGTLDPLAEGVLVICIGKATKLVQDIEGYEKTYTAGFELGYKTDTYDTEGEIIEKREVNDITISKLENVLKNFIGEIEQIPPMYSALKVDGKKLYELARQGIEIERKARLIEIKFIDIIEFDGLKGKIRCDVSKGTYIRSLIDDMGKALGTLATMTSLVREKVGNSNIKDSYTLEEIETMYSEKKTDFLYSVEDFFKYPKITLEGEKNMILFLNGNTVRFTAPDDRYRIYNNAGKFLGLCNVSNNLLKGYKYF